MLITEKNHLLEGYSEDFQNDYMWAIDMIKNNPDCPHTIFNTLAYLSNRARADLMINLHLESDDAKEYVMGTVAKNNETSIEFRMCVESN